MPVPPYPAEFLAARARAYRSSNGVAWIEKEKGETFLLVIDARKRITDGEAVASLGTVEKECLSGTSSPALTVGTPYLQDGRYIVAAISAGEWAARWAVRLPYVTDLGQTLIARADVLIVKAAPVT